MGRVPQRRCVGCGQSRPKPELLRYVAGPDGLERDSEGVRAGRGAYLCREEGADPDSARPAQDCARRALERRGFERALRRPVRIEAQVIDFDDSTRS